MSVFWSALEGGNTSWRCPNCGNEIMLGPNEMACINCIHCGTPYSAVEVDQEVQERLLGRETSTQQQHLVLKDYKALLEDDELADVVFEVEGEHIAAHKVILAARSQYFRKLLYGGMKESNSETGNRIPISLVSADNFRRILRYLYHGEPGTTTVDEALDLLACADMFQLTGLAEIFAARVRADLSSQNVLVVLRHARLHGAETLKLSALDYIQRHQADPVVQECVASFPIESIDDGKMMQEVLHHLMPTLVDPNTLYCSTTPRASVRSPSSTNRRGRRGGGGLGRGGRNGRGLGGYPAFSAGNS